VTRLASFLLVVLAAAPPLGAAATPVDEAERLAKQAVTMSSSQPDAALVQARRALTLTADFQPTAFVRAGRKGEVVEDAYVAAREEYRRHRAGLYEAVGLCLAAQKEHLGAMRYLRRATLLEPNAERAQALARAWIALGKGQAALDALQPVLLADEISAQTIALVEQAADAAELPSAQAEIDRARIARLPRKSIEYRDGPIVLPAGVKLSTSPVFRLEEQTTLVYVAEASCRSCSEDLETLKRAVAAGAAPVAARGSAAGAGSPPPLRVVLLPFAPEQDQALRQVVTLYRLPFPLLLGKGVPDALRLAPRDLLVVARGGWVAAVVKAPFAEPLSALLAVFGRADVRETIPRAAWNRRPFRAPPMPAPPALLPEGLAPGEDDPAPAEFTAAVVAYREGRAAEALKAFSALEARGDGWLLGPEARLDRALSMAKLGRREEARKLLLATGDSRFQEAVDKALEQVGTPPKPAAR
jgi:tetratricopeptide (TPR) repeat protein